MKMKTVAPKKLSRTKTPKKKPNKALLKKATQMQPIDYMEKKPFIIRTLEESTYKKMKRMNTTDAFIEKWQRQRIILSVVIAAIISVIVLVLHKPLVFTLAGVVVGVIFYVLKHVNVNQKYRVYLFNRNLEFSKFARLIHPYLRQAKNGTSVYRIFNQLVKRMENPIDKNLMQTLMLQITDKPSMMEPYIEFANKMSATDFSVTFMTLIYDISQGATDDTIIDELGKEVSQQLMDIISDIIEFEENKFQMFPTMIVAPNMILIMGYMICMGIFQFGKFKMGK